MNRLQTLCLTAALLFLVVMAGAAPCPQCDVRIEGMRPLAATTLPDGAVVLEPGVPVDAPPIIADFARGEGTARLDRVEALVAQADEPLIRDGQLLAMAEWLRDGGTEADLAAVDALVAAEPMAYRWELGCRSLHARPVYDFNGMAARAREAVLYRAGLAEGRAGAGPDGVELARFAGRLAGAIESGRFDAASVSGADWTDAQWRAAVEVLLGMGSGELLEAAALGSPPAVAGLAVAALAGDESRVRLAQDRPSLRPAVFAALESSDGGAGALLRQEAMSGDHWVGAVHAWVRLDAEAARGWAMGVLAGDSPDVAAARSACLVLRVLDDTDARAALGRFGARELPGAFSTVQARAATWGGGR